jgi:hypothetical protein
MGLPDTTTEAASTSEAGFDSQWSLLQAACSAINQEKKKARLRDLLRRPPNWEVLLKLAERHGVAPLLHRAVSSLGSEAPLAGASLLKRYYESNLHRTLFLARELIRILDHLGAQSLDVVPYKGVALAEALYGDIALRQAGDIDLLIRLRDLSRIKAALRELGYAPHDQFSGAEERAYLRSGYECAFDGSLGRNLLEVQWALQPHFYAVDFEMEDLFSRAITVSVAGRNMKAPAAEDLFLILSLHAAKHAWGRLIWLCDVAQLQKLPALNWDLIGERARALGIVRILQVSLVLTKLLLEAPIPTAAEQNLFPDHTAIVLADEVARGLRGPALPDVESSSYFRLMLRLRERSVDRIRFLRRLAFTPGPGEWKSLRLPAPLFPLYRLVRLWRLAARVAGASPAKS